MHIDLQKLNYTFLHKPLLIGGCAMEYYGLRKAGADIDFVVHPDDHAALVRLYPDHIKDIYGDIGVCEFGFEIWNQICTFDYEYLSEHAAEETDYLVVSLEKLLFLKALGMEIPKYHRDMEQIVKKILDIAYKTEKE
ncbi:MAG: hypothetical protein IKZ09_13045 [Clostridia bacterium]|nr:hypothetical protein [Clostridia bacterium]